MISNVIETNYSYDLKEIQIRFQKCIQFRKIKLLVR